MLFLLLTVFFNYKSNRQVKKQKLLHVATQSKQYNEGVGGHNQIFPSIRADNTGSLVNHSVTFPLQRETDKRWKG